VTLLKVLSKYLLVMELRFDAMLYCNMRNENCDAGHIKCSHRPHMAREPQVLHPCSRESHFADLCLVRMYYISVNVYR